MKMPKSKTLFWHQPIKSTEQQIITKKAGWGTRMKPICLRQARLSEKGKEQIETVVDITASVIYQFYFHL